MALPLSDPGQPASVGAQPLQGGGSRGEGSRESAWNLEECLPRGGVCFLSTLSFLLGVALSPALALTALSRLCSQ